MYCKYLFLSLVILLTSCNGQDSIDSNEITENDSSDFTKLEENFVFSFVQNYFFESSLSNELIPFRFELDLINNTHHKITRYKIQPKIIYQFGNEPENTKLNGCDGVKDIKPLVSADNPWLHGDSLRFLFTLPQMGDGASDACSPFSKRNFERTPNYIFLSVDLITVSVDQEFQETFRFDILDLWKDFQKELGLR